MKFRRDCLSVGKEVEASFCFLKNIRVRDKLHCTWRKRVRRKKASYNCFLNLVVLSKNIKYVYISVSFPVKRCKQNSSAPIRWSSHNCKRVNTSCNIYCISARSIIHLPPCSPDDWDTNKTSENVNFLSENDPCSACFETGSSNEVICEDCTRSPKT